MFSSRSLKDEMISRTFCERFLHKSKSFSENIHLEAFDSKTRVINILWLDVYPKIISTTLANSLSFCSFSLAANISHKVFLSIPFINIPE